MKLYLSQFRQNEKNTIYKTACDVQTFDDLKKAAARDHLAVKMKGSYRGDADENFLFSDCIMLDCDNSHSDEREDWKTPDDVADAFPDVPFWFIYSRNHMKPKAGKEARPKFHCYFPLSCTCANFTEYEMLILTAVGLFPFFDVGAAKTAQFFYGVKDPDGGEMPGDVFLDTLLQKADKREVVETIKDFKQRFGNASDGIRKGVSRLCSYFGIEKPPDERKQDPAELVARGHRHDYVIRRLGEFIGLLRGAADAETVYSMLYSDFQQHCKDSEDPPEEQFRKEWMPTVKKYLKDQAAAEKEPGFYSYARKAWEAEHPGQEFNSDWAAARAAALRAKEAGEEFDLTGGRKPDGRTYTADIVPETITLSNVSEIEEEPVDWLIPGYIPRGQISLLVGDGGTGKTSIWCNIVAGITAGTETILDEVIPFPDETEPGTCLFFSSEDSVPKVLKKRLRKAGADEKRILFLDLTDPNFQKIQFNAPELETLVKTHKPALVVFDPLQSFIPPDIQMGSRNAMRQCMSPLIGLGEKYGTTFLIVLHTNKKPGAYGRARCADSSDIWDIARSVMILGDTGEPGQYYLSHEKSNYSEKSRTVIYTISDGAAHYKGTTNKKDKDFVLEKQQAVRFSPVKKEAKENIMNVLSDNQEHKVSEVDEQVKMFGISSATLKRAKSELKAEGRIRFRSEGYGKEKTWYMKNAASSDDFDLNDLTLPEAN